MLGMAGCLAVGCSAAKTLAVALDKPLVGVHHMVSTDGAVSSQADSFSLSKAMRLHLSSLQRRLLNSRFLRSWFPVDIHYCSL